MAQRIFGIDLGSHLVKVSILELGFRQSQLKRVISVPVADYEEVPPVEPAVAAIPAGEEAPGPEEGVRDDDEAPEAATPEPKEILANEAAVLAALRAALLQANAQPDLAVLAVPGELGSFRVLEFPFHDAKKVAAVLPYELEEQIPFDIDDVVHDHLLTTTPGGDGRALVALAQVDRTRALLERIAEQTGLAPQILTMGPLGYGYLFADDPAPEGTTAVLDIGHARTNLTIHRGQDAVLVRTISRGGAHVTRGLAALYDVDLQRAEELKHTYAQIPGPGTAALAPDQEPIVRVVREEMAPLVRAVRQSLLALRNQPALYPHRLLLCGGGSAIAGLVEHLQAELELVVEETLPPAAPTGVGARGQVLAVGLSRLGADRRRAPLNLRQGPLALREDVSIFRKRALYFTWAAVAVLALLVCNGFMGLSTLRKEETRLRAKLAHTTLQIFNQPMNELAPVERKLSRALRRRKVSTLPIPDVSAYAVLSEMSRQVPGKKEVTLDITRLYIRSEKIDLEGTAKDAKEVERVVQALEKVPCFDKVEQGRVSEVTVREMVDGETKTDKRRKFSVDIAHHCI